MPGLPARPGRCGRCVVLPRVWSDVSHCWRREFADSFSRQSPLGSADYAAWERVEKKGTKKPGYRESRHLPTTSVSKLSWQARERFNAAIADGKVLNIGSGEKRITTDLKHWVNLDIHPHNNVDVVGDAHWLPFRDESFDAVTSSNVFAYLHNPFQAASEITRVLKPGGLAWCDEAFATPLSQAPRVCFRYGPDGLKSIFNGLTVVELSASAGPWKAIVRFAEEAIGGLFPGKLGFLARWGTAWALQPTKYLDDWIVKRNPDSASSFFIVARKSDV